MFRSITQRYARLIYDTNSKISFLIVELFRIQTFRITVYLSATLMLGGCATQSAMDTLTSTERIPHKEFVVSSGAFRCNVRADDPRLQFEEQIDPDYERAVFRIPAGSYRSVERFRLNQHPLLIWPNGETNERRLIQTIKLYVARVLIPNFELVEAVEAFTNPIDSQLTRYVVLNVKQGAHSQQHAFLFFFTPEFFNVMHYTNALVFEVNLLRRTMDEFYRQCEFNDRRPPTEVTPPTPVTPKTE